MLSVVVPVFNEEASLRLLHERLRKVLDSLRAPYEILFVNDGSTDASEARLAELAAADPSVRVINFRRNYGQTAALMAGFDYARGAVIVPMDGDLQNEPEDIPRLLAKLEEGYDVVSGWRKDRHDGARRNFFSRVANRMVSLIAGVPLHDYGCTLKAYRREVLEGVRLYGEMHRFIPVYASWQGARVTELQVNHAPRRFGVSKYGFERILKVILDLIVIKFLAGYANKPIYVFGGVGVASLALSLLTTLYAVWLKVVDGVAFILTPLPLLAVLTFLTGVTSILMGLLAELIMRTWYEAQGKPVYRVKSGHNLEKSVEPGR
ncbi:MAG TPA: glycosyltransferase family 2 protein [Burkholderiales bacterium]|nr:glycosyltransferase family 2 protein [Burkholderiales bacterium]